MLMTRNLLRRRRRRPRATMTDREFIAWMRDQCDLQLGTTPPGPDPDVESPTGREPRLVWTSALQRTYNRMLEEYEAGADTLGAIWCDLIFDNARGDRYADAGLWGALAYQITGDPSWVAEAWRKITPWLASALDDGNNRREGGQEKVIITEWLWPGLTEDQRGQCLEALDRLWGNCDVAAARLNDSDQIVGDYFGLACYHFAFGDIHPPAKAFFEHARVGGLDATSVDLKTTMRNSVAWCVEAAKGGEWIESGEYNMGTMRLVALGYAAMKTATGADHFPEIAAWLEGAGRRCPAMVAPDLEECIQWGDEQNPHLLEGWRWSSTAMSFNHPASRQLVYDLVAKLGARGSYSAEPTVARAFLLFDPYGERAPLSSPLFDSRGQGTLTMTSPEGARLWLHLPPTPWASSVDHLVQYYGDLQFYRKGWALTHPLMYGGYGNNGMACNVMLHRGVGTAKEWRGSNAVYHGADWLFAAGTSGGTILQSKFYQPPPTFWYEWSRSFLWIMGEVDTLIVFDRSHLDDPLTLPNCGKYPDDIEKKFNTNPLRLWRWHAPVRPTINGCSASWASDNDQAVRVTWQDKGITTRITDQSAEWTTVGLESERKFHVDVMPSDECGPWMTLITVLEFGDPAKFATIGFHEDPDQCAAAVTLGVSGQPSRVALFNTTPGPKLPTYGGNSAYHPEIPGLLAPVRFRDYPIPDVGARVWGMETSSGIVVVEP